MSFMFHPYPYADPKAVNPVVLPQSVKEKHVMGPITAAKTLIAEIEKGIKCIGIDHYPGTHVDALINCMRQWAKDIPVTFVNIQTCLKSAEEIEAIVTPYLPEDREMDPVLLYGVRFLDGYEALFAPEKLQSLKEQLQNAKTPIVVYGLGALCETLQDLYGIRVWMDVTPRTAVLNFKNGHFRNIGCEKTLPYSLMMRRNYYVDFEMAMDLRWQMLREDKLDYYVSADNPDKMQMLPLKALKELFEELNRRPFRCRPVYLEGVWGGQYFTRLRNLPKEMRNCAWVFDMIPMEVSLVAKAENFEFEVPFFTFVQAMGVKLLGQQAYDGFGGYFPIRFNYDDTYHASGNMSIQCHPDEKYVTTNHRELGRQDESYYICVTGQGAKTYLGFVDENSCETFLKEAHESEINGKDVDYTKYIHAEESVPGLQVMIPAGTVHASGRNQVILEIGSLTVGSYTYKLYDYNRTDILTGLRRPIHLKMGESVLRSERYGQWVKDNLVNHGGVVRQGEGWLEKVVGEHDLLYFSLRNLVFEREIEDNTEGLFHVLSLVDGEKVRVESMDDPSLFYEMNTMDIAVVPANFGHYRVINLGVGTVTVHKTHLKKEQ